MLNFFKKLFALIFRPRSDKKAVAPPPAPTVMNLWPDGANAVKAFLMVPTGDLYLAVGIPLCNKPMYGDKRLGMVSTVLRSPGANQA
ncbi:MAG: hypothetical protein UW41_C0029G0011 [Candidatus Collierbacteria bacterium GW2011_GWC2_44_18]|uniref:Uncharacterized protein n=1 Tax=Candidatus Collierbacteria bacterium GW2011_GWC2_44_18 TaxID=1618392 RepID=A0A0G1KKH4_9BACT|nr:MAG: hypothetical protein UW41_C0029G0011 [Candidatus Collierbacteria bacterium GW2011_GWC2_44_18]